MFDKTRRAIDKVNSAMDKVADVVDKANRATTVKKDQTLRGKAAQHVRGKLPQGPAKCRCGKIARGKTGNCGKPACIRAQAEAMAHVHQRNTDGKKFKPTGKEKGK